MGDLSTTHQTDYLDRLTAEYDKHIEAIDSIQRSALEAGKDLSADQDAECQRHQDEAEKLQPQIKRWSDLRKTRSEMVTQREAMPPAMTPSVKVTERVDTTERRTSEDGDDAEGLKRIHRSAGAFLADRFAATHRGDPGARERVQRALAKVMTSDTPGLLPIPFVGDLIGRVTSVRPIVQSATSVPLPASGMKWRRPRITQHTSVDKQTTEKTEVSSRKLTVDSVEVALETFAGAVNMSIQEMERTDPSALDLVFSDLAAQYGKRTEKAAADALVAGVTETVDLAAGADDKAIREALFGAAPLVYEGTDGELPNVIYASVDQWARLGAFAKSINPQNADISGNPGSLDLTAAGLRAVVSPQLPTGTLIVGNSRHFEVTEQAGAPVQLRALEVGILGWEVGVYGMFASLVANPAAFVKLVAPAAGGGA